MTLAVLMVDGLDHRYAVRFRSLRLRHCGRYEADVEKNSVQLWASFLTGREVDFDEFVVKRFKWLPYKPIAPLVRWRPRHFFRAPSFRGETFIDEVERALAVNVFCYNEAPESLEFRVRNSIPRLLSRGLDARARAVRERVELERRLFGQFVDALSAGRYELGVTYLRLVDDANHLLGSPLPYYPVVARMVDRLLRAVRCDVLIVSDHGGRGGRHTPDAHWASTVELPREPESVTDWRDIILGLLRSHSAMGAPDAADL